MNQLDKLKLQTDLALAEVKALLAYYWLKGGAGSGNWGHAGGVGGPGKPGGSAPKGQGMSMTTGRDADRRQQEAKLQRGFFKGNIKTASVQEIYDGSSDEVKALADETGIIATDPATKDYLNRNRYALGSIRDASGTVVVAKDHLESALQKVRKMGYHNSTIEETLKFKGEGPGSLLYTKMNHHTAEGLRMLNLAVGSEYSVGGVKYAPGKDDFHVAPTDSELAVLHKISGKVTKQGGMSKDVVEAFDNLNPAERNILDGYGKRVTSLQALDVSGAVVRAGVLQGKEERAAVKLKNSLSQIALTDPIKPNEKLVDYAARIISAYNPPPYTPKNFATHEMAALATASAAERDSTVNGINSSWDTKTHGGFRLNAKNVFYVKDSPDNQAAFEKARDAAGGETTRMYHGTSTMAGGRIVSTGFIVPPKDDPKNSGRMLDAGVYLANNASKSAQYFRPDGALQRTPGTTGTLMVVEAALGKQTNWKENPNWRKDIKSGQVDTVFAPKGSLNPEWGNKPKIDPLKNDEWSVRNPAAVRPRYMVEAELTAP